MPPMNEPPKIFCYYEGAGPHQDMEHELIELWRSAWTAHGWCPTVLRLADALQHPKFVEMMVKTKFIPTQTDFFYHQMTYLRWLAFARYDGVYADYDVFPRREVPEIERHVPVNGTLTLQPGFISATRDWCENLIETFLAFEPTIDQKQVSDQEIVRSHPELFGKVLDLCRVFGEVGWETVPLVHYSNDALRYRVSAIRYLQRL